MYQRFKDRFGSAGVVVAVIALVAALGGTALAASGALTGKQKKEVEKIAKKYAGKPGAPGAQGPAGPQGAAGANGKDGAQGAQGAKGDTGSQGATGAQGPKGDTGSAGATGATGATGAAGAAGPPGPEGPPGEPGEPGSPWTAGGTVPTGETLKGAWNVSAENGGAFFGELSVTTISFALPLSENLAPAKMILTDADGNETCTGSSTNPTAPAATLCVYEALSEGLAAGEVSDLLGASKIGATIAYDPSETKGFATGTWAVTAP